MKPKSAQNILSKKKKKFYFFFIISTKTKHLISKTQRYSGDRVNLYCSCYQFGDKLSPDFFRDQFPPCSCSFFQDVCDVDWMLLNCFFIILYLIICEVDFGFFFFYKDLKGFFYIQFFFTWKYSNPYCFSCFKSNPIHRHFQITKWIEQKGNREERLYIYRYIIYTVCERKINTNSYTWPHPAH